MTDEKDAIVPVWTLATGDGRIPAVSLDQPMTTDRLSELRGALATLADQPIATLEVHRLRSGSIVRVASTSTRRAPWRSTCQR